MKSRPLLSITFKRVGSNFTGLIPIGSFLSAEEDLHKKLQSASSVYGDALTDMRATLAGIQQLGKRRAHAPARLVWRLGNSVFSLKRHLAQLSFEVDGLYDHICRDLEINRKWLEKVVILRRYVGRENLLPTSLTWGQIDKGTRRKLQAMGFASNQSRRIPVEMAQQPGATT